ncbi:MAG: DUF1579 family protein [Armatimonadetes bacterium]|nr:DUF1579 family protein [Armatimonadota bacterium]
MHSYSALGYDVSFKEYRGCWFADMSSHLWKQVGKLSDDGKTMTLTCDGPHMTKDGETALWSRRQRPISGVHDAALHPDLNLRGVGLRRNLPDQILPVIRSFALFIVLKARWLYPRILSVAAGCRGCDSLKLA